MERAKQLAVDHKPEEMMDKLFDADDKQNSLNCPKQAENIRNQHLRELRGNLPRTNLADEIFEILSEEGKLWKNRYTQIVMFNKKTKMPIIILYDADMLADIRAHCGSGAMHPSVLGIDTTFNLSSCKVTITVYKQKNLVRPGKYVKLVLYVDSVLTFSFSSKTLRSIQFSWGPFFFTTTHHMKPFEFSRICWKATSTVLWKEWKCQLVEKL